MSPLPHAANLRRPDFRITCCLCGRPIGKTATHHGLDREWRRRFPQFPGSLAHERCAVFKHEWKCQDRGGHYPNEHLTSYRYPDRTCLDAWDHHNGEGDQKAMVTLMPWSGMLQGAEDYLRWLAGWHRASPTIRIQLTTVIERWDAPGGKQFALDHSHWNADRSVFNWPLGPATKSPHL